MDEEATDQEATDEQETDEEATDEEATDEEATDENCHCHCYKWMVGRSDGNLRETQMHVAPRIVWSTLWNG